MSLLLLGQKLIEKAGWIFAPVSRFYALAVFCRNWLYDRGILSVFKVPCTVVSVGNIVAGGTGKTPFVHLLAKAFSSRKVAVLSRGYGPIPDEPMLLARRLPHARIYVGKDRVQLAKQAALEGAELLILDDGFQHRRLHRDFDIVLESDRKEHYLPWGFLRDSPKRLQRADARFKIKLKVSRILDLKEREIPSIQGWKVGIFSGIAKPQKFKKTVESLGAEVIKEWVFGDHQLADLSKLHNIKALICTEKDFMKLPPTDLPIYFLEVEADLSDQKAEWEMVVEKIDQKIDNRPTYER